MNRIYRHILTVMAVSWLAVAGIPPVYAAIVPSRICSDVCQAADVPQVTGGDDSRSDKVVLTMEECRSMALRNNAAVRNAQLDVIAARAQKGEALSEYFPKVSVNAFGYYAFDPMLEVGVKDILGDSDAANNLNSWVSQIAPLYGIDPVFSTMKQGYSATVSAVQPVFAGGRIVSGNRLASLGVEAARLKSSLQRRKSVEEVEQDYWQVISLKEKMKTLGSVQEMLDNLEKDVDAVVRELDTFERYVSGFGVETLNERHNSPLDYCKLYRERYLPSERQSKALGARIIWLDEPAARYREVGERTLTDGLFGGASFVESWTGWEGCDAAFIVDLGEAKEFTSVEADFLHQLGQWVLLPKSVTYALSSDDETWREFGRVEFPEDQSVQVKFVPARVESPQPVRARYIRVSVEGTKICPSWHYGVGCPCWFFIDEVSVF